MKEMRLNPLPALTWNWLRMNKALWPQTEGKTEGRAQNESAALKANPELKARAAKISVSKLPKGAEHIKDARKELLSLKEISCALGKDFDNFLSESECVPEALTFASGTKASEPIFVRVEPKEGEASFGSLVIKAMDNVEADIIIEWAGAKKAEGLNAFQTKIYAGYNSRVHVSTVQLLGSGFVHFNDVGTIGREGSDIQVTQLELGADKIFMGVRSALNEARSGFRHDAAYCLDKSRELDMNFLAEQTGRATKSLMNVYGTLKDGAKKTYRGTIDFKKGCAGSIGNETEETLLLSPDVVNKSIPLILCDEEDVQGEHGATIGRLDEALLFYMETRGVSEEEARKMMARSKIARVAALIGDDGEAQKALDFFDECFGGQK